MILHFKVTIKFVDHRQNLLTDPEVYPCWVAGTSGSGGYRGHPEFSPGDALDSLKWEIEASVSPSTEVHYHIQEIERPPRPPVLRIP